MGEQQSTLQSDVAIPHCNCHCPSQHICAVLDDTCAHRQHDAALPLDRSCLLVVGTPGIHTRDTAEKIIPRDLHVRETGISVAVKESTGREVVRRYRGVVQCSLGSEVLELEVEVSHTKRSQ